QQTVLVPNNDAFIKYQQTTGHSIGSLSPNTTRNLLQYHTLNTSLTSAILAKQQNMVVSTQLVDEKYNSRGGADDTNLDTNGQVVYISTTESNQTFHVRQKTMTASLNS